MHRIPWMPKYPYSSSYGQNYIYSWCNEENFATGEYINQVPDFLWPLTAFAYCLYPRYFQTIFSVWVASILISSELFPAHLIYSEFRMSQFPQALTRGCAGCRLPQLRGGSPTAFLPQGCSSLPGHSMSVSIQVFLSLICHLTWEDVWFLKTSMSGKWKKSRYWLFCYSRKCLQSQAVTTVLPEQQRQSTVIYIKQSLKSLTGKTAWY